MLFKHERQILSVLLIAAILLPVASTFLFLFGRITFLLGDVQGSRILDGTAIVITIFWIVDFVALVFALTVRSLATVNEEQEEIASETEE